jgi:hypothetical protein
MSTAITDGREMQTAVGHVLAKNQLVAIVCNARDSVILAGLSKMVVQELALANIVAAESGIGTFNE